MKQEFTIQATAAAFETLTTKLYSNPILAVIRELSTNGNDAHILAGTTDKAMELHLPTDDNPFFKIRDFGPGMDEDTIFSIYTSFFCSTKTGDDSQTGYFGLGSKSPFAVSKNFTVKSYTDGTVKTYKMSSETGLPTCELLATETTSEPNGLEIKIDNLSNSYRWFREAKSLFKGTAFLPKLNFSDSDLEELLKERPRFLEDRIETVDDTDHYYSKNAYVNVAGVTFPIDLNSVSKAERAMDGLHISFINITAQKNDVTITPSREELHYDDKTVSFINNKIASKIFEYVQKADYTSSANDLVNFLTFDEIGNDEIDEKIEGAKKFANELFAGCGLIKNWYDSSKRYHLHEYEVTKPDQLKNIFKRPIKIVKYDTAKKVVIASIDRLYECTLRHENWRGCAMVYLNAYQYSKNPNHERCIFQYIFTKDIPAMKDKLEKLGLEPEIVDISEWPNFYKVNCLSTPKVPGEKKPEVKRGTFFTKRQCKAYKNGCWYDDPILMASEIESNPNTEYFVTSSMDNAMDFISALSQLERNPDKWYAIRKGAWDWAERMATEKGWKNPRIAWERAQIAYEPVIAKIQNYIDLKDAASTSVFHSIDTQVLENALNSNPKFESLKNLNMIKAIFAASDDSVRDEYPSVFRLLNTRKSKTAEKASEEITKELAKYPLLNIFYMRKNQVIPSLEYMAAMNAFNA